MSNVLQSGVLFCFIFNKMLILWEHCVIFSLLFTGVGFPQAQWGVFTYIFMIYQWGKDQKEACHCVSALTAVLLTWAAGTDVRAGVPSTYHAIHGVAVVNGAMGYQIWRRGRTVLPLLTDTCQGINWSCVTSRHPWFTHWRSGAWCWSGEYLHGWPKDD